MTYQRLQSVILSQFYAIIYLIYPLSLLLGKDRLLEQLLLLVFLCLKLRQKQNVHLRWLGPWVLHYLFVPFRDRLHQIVWVQRKWNLGLELYVVSLLIFSYAIGKRMLTFLFLVCFTFFLFSCYFKLFFQHGEPGAAVVDIQPVDVVVSHVLQQILSPVFALFLFSLLQFLLFLTILCILWFIYCTRIKNRHEWCFSIGLCIISYCRRLIMFQLHVVTVWFWWLMGKPFSFHLPT